MAQNIIKTELTNAVSAGANVSWPAYPALIASIRNLMYILEAKLQGNFCRYNISSSAV